MFTVQENRDPKFVKCECKYISLSIWTNMVDVMVGLNVFMLLSSKLLKMNMHLYMYIYL